MKRKKFKQHEICLLIDAIVHDERAIDTMYNKVKTTWSQKYLNDEDDRAAGVALLCERIFMANHLAHDYCESTGWTAEFQVPMINLNYLLDSTEWRQLNDLEVLQLLLDLKEGTSTENGLICFLNTYDLEQLNVLIMYYYSKNLKGLIERHGSI